MPERTGAPNPTKWQTQPLKFQEFKYVDDKIKEHLPVDVIPVEDSKDIDKTMECLVKAQLIFSTFSQAKVNYIVEKTANHFLSKSSELGKLAYEETGMGKPEDKDAKNIFATDYIKRAYRDLKTCGVVERDDKNAVDVIAFPMGVILAVIPTTNPTSSVVFKALCCLKTRNAIFVAPHPRARRCTYQALKVLMEGAVEAGAPKDIAACIITPTIELTGKLMKNPAVSLILATGGPGMVVAASSSGNPSLGVGPGNVPVVVDEFANLEQVAENVIDSKNFDNGLMCTAEQVVIVNSIVYDDLKSHFIKNNAYFLTKFESIKLEDLIREDKSASFVGQSAIKIAEIAKIDVPVGTRLLIAEIHSIETSLFAREKLYPVIGIVRGGNISELFRIAVRILSLGGEGHTACYYTNAKTQSSRISRFSNAVNVTRCLINQPTTLGSLGGIYNFGLNPSMTLGCGTYGNSYISDNVCPSHLLNYKRVSRPAEDHMVVLKNHDRFVPKRTAVRCAMEMAILTIVLVAKGVKSCEFTYNKLDFVFESCCLFLKSGESLQALRECIEYFLANNLYELGSNELQIDGISQEFNLAKASLYLILWQHLSGRLENVNWEKLHFLNADLKSLEDASKLIYELADISKMSSTLSDTVPAQMRAGGFSLLSDVIMSNNPIVDMPDNY